MVIQITKKSLFEGTFAWLKRHKQNAGCEPVGQADRGPTAVHGNLVQVRPTRSRLLTSPFGGDIMISVITPAHNEEQFIKDCLCSVKVAAKAVSEEVEHIVVLNRCTDRTGEIATQLGARVITDDSRNLSRIRNKGAEASNGDILVTIDADSQMTSNMMIEVLRKLQSGKYIGGGVKIVPECSGASEKTMKQLEASMRS